MENFNHKKNLAGTCKSKCFKTLFMRVKTLMHVTKKGDAILIYIFHTPDVESHQHEMLLQYKLKNTRMCLKTRILNTLLQHQPYNCTINL